MKDACILSSLQCDRILSEPVASLMSALNDVMVEEDKADDEEKQYLVFDMGGDALDLTLLSYEQGEFSTREYSTDPVLGGRALDEVILDMCCDEIKSKSFKDITTDKVVHSRLKVECEKAKIRLSEEESTTISIPGLSGDFDFEMTITR